MQLIVGMDSFKGRAADSVKGYLSEIHYVILFSLSDIFTELFTRFLLYKDGYYTAIDSDNHARISEEVLSQAFQAFTVSRADFESSNTRTQNIATSISDIMNANPPAFFGVFGAYDAALDRQNSLKNNVNSYESGHFSTDFANLDALISSLRSFIAEYQAKSNDTAVAYVPGSIANSVNIGALGQALYCSGSDRKFLAGDIEAASERERARFEELQAEWAKQREEQGWLDLLVGGLIVVGGVVCIVATAGLATPLVVAGAIAGGGTILYGASNMFAAGQDIHFGAQGDYYTSAFNPMRDTIFEWAFGADGKQQAWDTFGTVAIASSTVMTLGAGAIGASSAAVNAGTSTVRAVGVYGAKVAVSAGAGYVGGMGSREAALFFGADETVANIFGVIGGTAAGIGTGLGAQRLDQSLNLSGYYRVTPPVNTTPVHNEIDDTHFSDDITTPSRNSDPNAAPGGTRTPIHENDRPSTIRDLQLENEGAEVLARNGYDVQQNPTVTGTKNPDYLVEGEVFDCYAPRSETSSNSVYSRIDDKVFSGQTERIVLNTTDWTGDISQVQGMLNEYPIVNLREVIVVDGSGSVIRIFP
jgi:hypothetical protein